METSGNLHMADLIAKSVIGRLTEDEAVELNEWRKRDAANEDLYRRIVSLKGIENRQEKASRFPEEEVWRQLRTLTVGKKKRQLRLQWMKYAALVCLCIGGGLLAGKYYMGNGTEKDVAVVESGIKVPSIAHGSSKALLILDDGEEVVLGSGESFSTKDAVVEDGGDAGVITYKKSEDTAVRMNRLVVPRGGEYNVVLADGTMVYLNAESELYYPVAFGGERREVELKGEAYFKVVKDEGKPFVVKTKEMSVRVWGTEFNVNTQREQQYYATTLVEGKVEVQVPGHKPYFLEPSQQLRLDSRTAEVSCVKVNTLPYTAWKDGKFVFNHERMEEVTAKLEKWYDVEFCYPEEALKGIGIFGIISRYEDINKVLNILSSTRLVGFEYRDGKIYVVAYAEN